MTAIQTAARILSRYDEVPAEKAAKFVEIITQESTRLGGADRLRAPGGGARGAGGQAGSARAVASPSCSSGCWRRSRGRSQERQLTVQVKVAAGLDQITGDADQLESALRAMVKNAVEFNRRAAAVR